MITLILVLRQLDNSYEVKFKRDRLERLVTDSGHLKVLVADSTTDRCLVSASLRAALHALFVLQQEGQLDNAEAGVIADFKSIETLQCNRIEFNANFTVFPDEYRLKLAAIDLPTYGSH